MTVYSQQSDFSTDLDFVFEKLQNTTSYKTQKNNQKNVHLKYNELKIIAAELGVFESFIKLHELVDQLDDYHNNIYGNTESFSYNDLKDETFLNQIKTSPKYNFYHKTSMNLDSLENELSKREVNDFEGIYQHQHFFKIAIVKKEGNLFEGIVLESKIPTWQTGEVMLYIIPKTENRFRIFSGSLIDKKLFSGIDYFVNGEFKYMRWQKKVPEINHYDVNFSNQKFVFKQLNEVFTYVKLGSFNSSNKGIAEATDFYNQICDSIITQNLIIDLRNNSGGGNKSSAQFYKLFKKFKGNIYILINFHTVSNAEQFTYKMKLLKNVTLLGDNSKGMLTYGRNYSNDLETPSKRFKIYFTDMKDNWKKYIIYEETGIKPDVYLKTDSDWIEQVIQLHQ